MADVKIGISVDDNASGPMATIRNATYGMRDALENLKGRGAAALESIKNNYTALHFAAVDALDKIKLAWALVEEFAGFAEQKESLNVLAAKYGTTADNIILDLQRITRGMVSMSDITATATESLFRRLTPDQINQMADAAVRLSNITGQKVATSFGIMAEAVARGNERALRGAGIYIDLNAIYGDSYVKSNDFQKAQMALAASLNAVNAVAPKTGDAIKGLDDNMETITVKIKDLRLWVGDRLYEAFGRVVVGVLNVAGAYTLLDSILWKLIEVQQYGIANFNGAAYASDQSAAATARRIEIIKQEESWNRALAESFDLEETAVKQSGAAHGVRGGMLRTEQSFEEVMAEIIAQHNDKLKANTKATLDSARGTEEMAAAVKAADKVFLGIVNSLEYGRSAMSDYDAVQEATKATVESLTERHKRLTEEITRTKTAVEAARTSAEATAQEFAGRYATAMTAARDAVSNLGRVEREISEQRAGYAAMIAEITQADMSDRQQSTALVLQLQLQYNEALALEGPARVAALNAWMEARRAAQEIIAAMETDTSVIPGTPRDFQGGVGLLNDLSEAQREVEATQNAQLESAEAGATGTVSAAGEMEVAWETAQKKADYLNESIDDLNYLLDESREIEIDTDSAESNLENLMDMIEDLEDTLRSIQINFTATVTASPTRPFSEGLAAIKARFAELPTEHSFDIRVGSSRESGTVRGSQLYAASGRASSGPVTFNTTLNVSGVNDPAALAKKIDVEQAKLWTRNRSSLKTAMNTRRKSAA
jgi:hypothetical protein